MSGSHNSSLTSGNRGVSVSQIATRRVTEVGSMAVLPVVLCTGEGKVVETSAFLDPGSGVSFCTKGIVRNLKLKDIDFRGSFSSDRDNSLTEIGSHEKGFWYEGKGRESE